MFIKASCNLQDAFIVAQNSFVIESNLSDLVSDLDKNNGPYWALSEIFNVIVLNLVELQDFLKDPEGVFYPDLKKVYPEIEEIWKNSNGNIREFVEKSLEVLKK